MVMREVFVSKKIFKIYENKVRNPKFMPSFTFSKALRLAGLESLLGQFWPKGLMFDNPALDNSMV